MISVALCTYNGEQYIGEQLESLATQTRLPDEVVIFDDASTDRTPEILRAFQKNAPFSVRFSLNKESPVGVVQNFSRAIEACNGDYIALCDQDDRWVPEKLDKSLSLLWAQEANVGKGIPLLVHTDLQVVSETLQEIAPSMMERQGLQHESNMWEALSVLLTQNYVTGCTVIINRALRDVACPIPGTAVMHDWWLALIAAMQGKIFFLPEATVKYRQHSQNQIGAKSYNWKSIGKRVINSGELVKSVQAALRQAVALVEREACGSFLASDYLNKFLLCVQDGNISELWKLGVHKQGMIRNLGYFFMLISHKKEFQNTVLQERGYTSMIGKRNV